MKPPYKITPLILVKVASISEKIGEVKIAYLFHPPAELRRSNRIKTIQSSLEIEGNTMTVEQVTALINNKRVLAPEKDILEVKNAIATYEQIDSFKPYSLKSLLKAHKLLMNGLVNNAGNLRTKSVGIVKGSETVHVAPPADRIEFLVEDLLEYAKKDDDLLLLKSCVFHYEFEFIHPFMDGNGRIRYSGDMHPVIPAICTHLLNYQFVKVIFFFLNSHLLTRFYVMSGLLDL